MFPDFGDMCRAKTECVFSSRIHLGRLNLKMKTEQNKWTFSLEN